MKKDEYKKEFCKLIEKFNYKHSRWTVWNDFLHMAAISLANVVQVKERQEREELYMKIVGKYSKEEVDTLVEMFRIIIMALDVDPRQDFLGEVYHALNLQQHQKGQFFTPYHICEFMSEIQVGDLEGQLEEKDYATVSDPACGAGAMLIAFANVALKHKVNYQQKVLFVAQDIDLTAVLMCYIQLSLLGCSAIVIRGDSLAKPGFHKDNDVWITVMYYMNRYKFNDFWKEEEKSEPEQVKELLKVEPDITIQKEYLEDKNGQLQLDLG